MRSSAPAILLVLLASLAGAPPRSAPGEEASAVEELAALGRKAAATDSIRLIATVSPQDAEGVPSTRATPAAVVLAWDGAGRRLRTEEIKPSHVAHLLVDERGAVQWSSSGLAPSRALRFPAEQFLPARDDLRVEMGTTGILLDALHGYAGVLRRFDVEALPPEETGEARFALAVKADPEWEARRAFEGARIEMGVDLSTGLVQDLRVGRENDFARIEIVSFERHPAESFLLPEAIREAGVYEASTGERVDLERR